MSSNGFTPVVLCSQLRNVRRRRPRACLPTVPQCLIRVASTNSSDFCFLNMCPRNRICLVAIVVTNSLELPERCNTSSLENLSANFVLGILRRNHISAACNRLSMVLLMVQLSQQYNNVDQMLHFNSLTRVASARLFDDRTRAIFMYAAFAIPIRLLISSSGSHQLSTCSPECRTFSPGHIPRAFPPDVFPPRKPRR